jgi:hypothetical protein
MKLFYDVTEAELYQNSRSQHLFNILLSCGLSPTTLKPGLIVVNNLTIVDWHPVMFHHVVKKYNVLTLQDVKVWKRGFRVSISDWKIGESQDSSSMSEELYDHLSSLN